MRVSTSSGQPFLVNSSLCLSCKTFGLKARTFESTAFSSFLYASYRVIQRRTSVSQLAHRLAAIKTVIRLTTKDPPKQKEQQTTPYSLIKALSLDKTANLRYRSFSPVQLSAITNPACLNRMTSLSTK